MSAHTKSPSIANSLDDSAALLDYSASLEDLLVDLRIVGVAEVGLQLTVSARGSPHQLKTLCRFQWQRIETIVDSDGTHRCVAKKATNQEGTLYIVQDSDTECVIRVVAAQNKSEKSKQLVFADTWAPVVRKPSFKHALPRTFLKDPESKSRRNAVSAILQEPTEDGAELEPLISSKKEHCTHALLQLILSSHFLFSKMPPEHLESIIGASKKKDVSKGQVLVKRGDPAQHLYIIETGEYDVLPDEHHGTRPSTTLVGGTIFGEASLMYQCKRAVSVVAKTEGTVWELANVDFYQALRNHMRTSARCKVKRYLMTLPMFRYLTERSMETLVSLCHIVTHPAGTTVARRTHRSGIFFVQAGILDIMVNGTKMRSLQAGKFFGESCLNIPEAGHQQVHEISSGDAMAQTDVSLLLIHPEELLLQLPAIVPIFWKAHILEALRRLPAFEDLEQNDVGPFLSQFVQKEYTCRTPLTSVDTSSACFTVITQGVVAVYEQHNLQEPAAFLSVANSIGSTSLLNHTVNTRSAVVHSSFCTCLELSRQHFEELLKVASEKRNTKLLTSLPMLSCMPSYYIKVQACVSCLRVGC
jgi:CRP-like cAMP-binding protein